MEVSTNVLSKPARLIGSSSATNARGEYTKHAPKLVSIKVGKFGQQASLGLLLKLKFAYARVRHLEWTASAMRARLVFAAVASALAICAAWLGLTVFSANPHHAALAFPVAEVADVVVTEEAAAEIAAAFNETLSRYQPALLTESSLEARAHLLRRYLNSWNSPLAQYADIIAAQSHWKMILAISFAESGLGKRCADNNCSGIGVAPGHPKWQTYATKGDWVKSMNRLLEKRYKNQTLQQMCGVYVQPCNPGWMAATTQILNELKVWSIN